MEKKINNILYNLKSSDLGFKTPKNYFENFNNDLENPNILKLIKKDGFVIPNKYFKKVNNTILSNSKPIQIPEGTGFATPDNYFENLKITSHNKTTNKKEINLFQHKYKKFINLSIAASLLLLIGINYFANNQKTINIDNLTANEIEKWINDDLIGFNTYDIAEAYEGIDINDNSLFFEDEISDYLEEKDLELLYLEN